MTSLVIALPVGGDGPRKVIGLSLVALLVDAVAASVRFHRWRLGFRQCSFRLITRVLQDGTLSAFWWLPLFGHALFPSSFRLQVNPMTQKHSSEFLLTVSGIQHRVPRRTLATHAAQAFTNAPRRTRPCP